jgi:hypothetical protein
VGGNTYCSETTYCYKCDNGYSWDGTACVTSCVENCDFEGAKQCKNTLTPQVCTDNDPSPGKECLQWKDQATCTSPQTCSGGICTTPVCVPTTETCNNKDDDCDNQIDENIPNCVNGQITYTITTSLPSTMTAGTTYKTTSLTISPNPGSVRWYSYGSFGGSTSLSTTEIQLQAPNTLIGASGTQTLVAKDTNGNTIATKPYSILVTCDQDDPCHCSTTTTHGCVSNAQHASIDPASTNTYCPDSMACVSCDLNYRIFGTLCAQCATASDCPQISCKTASCTSGTCAYTNIAKGETCNDAGTCDGNGACSACDPAACAKKDTVTITNSTPTISGCTKTTLEVTTTKTHSCNAMQQCVETARTAERKITENLPDGSACGSNLICLQGQCSSNLCQSDPCATVDWTALYTTCTGTVTNVCGTKTCTSTGFIDKTCATGICKPSSDPYRGICSPACETLTTPGAETTMLGCKPVQLAADSMGIIDNKKACPGNDICYVCKQGYVYHPADQRCIPTAHSLTIQYSQARMNEEVRITAILKSTTGEEKDAVFRLTSANGQQESTGTFRLHFPVPGAYPVTVVALKNSVPLATATADIQVFCDGSACCPEGALRPIADGMRCTQDGVSGVCSAGTCQLSCQRESARETGKGVNDEDRCNNAKDDDCDGLTNCQDSDCAGFCDGLRCDPDERICGGVCTAIQKDNFNCGTCDTSCSTSQQCMEGKCVEVDNCRIVCNKDRDCGRDFICINPGDCKKSFCSPINTMIVNETTANALTRDIMRARTFIVEKQLEGKTLTLTVKNLAPVPLRNYTLIVTLPKDVAPSASSIGADVPFTVIEEDPVVMFTFTKVEAKQHIVIDLPTSPDSALVKSVQVSGTHNTPDEDPELLTEKDMTITTNFVAEGNRTRIVLGVDPHSSLSGVRVPVAIPKCMAESVSELTLSGDYEVINDDPLVVWTFDTLDEKETLEILAPKNVDEACKSGLTAFAVADFSDKPISPWLPLIIIPIIGVIIVFFHRFHASGEAQERMNRDEFESFAREQGISDEKVEDEWEEYQKRF